jgi:integrase
MGPAAQAGQGRGVLRRPEPEPREGADGRWHAWVTVGTKPNGRPDQRHISRPTKAETEDAADDLLDAARAGQTTKTGRKPTVQEWLTTYLDTVAPRSCNPGTVYDYRSKMRNWVYPEVGPLRIDRLTPEHLDAIYLKMDRAGKAGSHALKVHRILSRALKVALRRGIVPRNVAELVDAPSGGQPDMKYLSKDAALAVLGAAAGRRNAARWSVALALGLRQGEALGLRWAHVDLAGGEMHIPKQLRRRIYEHGCGGTCGRKRGAECPQRSKGGLVFADPKARSKRTIPLPAPLVAALISHRETQQLERTWADWWWDEQDMVFAQPNGRPVDPRGDYDDWVDLLKAAGVDHVRLHDARHTAATLLRAQGVELRVIGEILGHTDSRTTARYAHQVDELTRDATDRIGRALFPEQ